MDASKKDVPSTPKEFKASTDEDTGEKNLPSATGSRPDLEQKRDDSNLVKVSGEGAVNIENPSASSEDRSGNEKLSDLGVIPKPNPETQPQLKSGNKEIKMKETSPEESQTSKTKDEKTDQNPNEGHERSVTMEPLFVNIPDNRFLDESVAVLDETAAVIDEFISGQHIPSFANITVPDPTNRPLPGEGADDYITRQIAKYEAAAEEIDKFVDYMNNMSVEE